MKIKMAAAQYPISSHDSFADWQTHTAGWVQEATNEGAKILLFPEYGAMELVSTFEDEIQKDLLGQIRKLQEIKDAFCSTFEELSRQTGTVIIAPSLPIADRGRVVNRAFVFSPEGSSAYQDKFFMTRFEAEEWHIQHGEPELTLFETDWGSFGIQTCYDIEFPLGSALLAGAGADVILVPSCTETVKGATRVHIGSRARALENQIYALVSQTVGEALWSPAVDINYGFSALYSTPDINFPEEGILAAGTPQEVRWLIFETDLSLLKTVREEGQVFNYKDLQRITFGLRPETMTIRKVRL